ncbi:MAG: argininosuccinate lyase [candidate division WOR-3 bacterium]
MKDNQPIWQKRFGSDVNRQVLNFTSSVDDDRRLVLYDIICSRAHARALQRAKIISRRDYMAIDRGLRIIEQEFKKGRFKLKIIYEDVHMNIEKRLKQLIGATADKLHTARSRNDLIAADLRLYINDKIIELMRQLIGLEDALLVKADKNLGVIMPGYTHWQMAQPILVSFYFLSYFFKFQRDFDGLRDILKRVRISPLSSAALAGTSLSIDSHFLARMIKFDKPVDNALDGVGDRDFLMETIYYLNQMMIHISSLAEEMIIFSTQEFGLGVLDDAVTTGSSIMPQKKNPDVCELLRARAGRAIGRLTATLTILKGLPASYNRDLQDLKRLLFEQIDDALESLQSARLLIRAWRFNKSRLEDWASTESFACTGDLVEFLVRKGYPFRTAYNIVAESVQQSNGVMERFIRLCGERFKIQSKVISEILKPRNSIEAKISKSSTGLKPVMKSFNRARRIIKTNERVLKRFRPVVSIKKQTG